MLAKTPQVSMMIWTVNMLGFPTYWQATTEIYTISSLPKMFLA
jgi:hypothetical protein